MFVRYYWPPAPVQKWEQTGGLEARRPPARPSRPQVLPGTGGKASVALTLDLRHAAVGAEHRPATLQLPRVPVMLPRLSTCGDFRDGVASCPPSRPAPSWPLGWVGVRSGSIFPLRPLGRGWVCRGKTVRCFRGLSWFVLHLIWENKGTKIKRNTQKNPNTRNEIKLPLLLQRGRAGAVTRCWCPGARSG